MRRLLIILPVLLSQIAVDGQELLSRKTQDLELWSSISVERDLGKKFDIELSQAYRSNNYGTTAKQIFTDIGSSYKLNKRMKLGAKVRVFQYGGNVMRLQGDLSYKSKKLDRFRIGGRLRYQSVLDPKGTFEDVARLKVETEYNIKGMKVDPFFSVESFFSPGYLTMPFDTYRLTLGADWRYKKRQSLKLYFRLEEEVFAPEADRVGVISLNWSYKLKS